MTLFIVRYRPKCYLLPADRKTGKFIKANANQVKLAYPSEYILVMEKIMNSNDLIRLYNQYKRKHGKNTYRYISKILKVAKEQHKQSFLGKDHEQSWRAFKGKNLEKLIFYVIEEEVRAIGLEILSGSRLERTKEDNLDETIARVKRNLLIDYGEFGYHLPDADLIIFKPNSGRIIAILSIKVTLRERITQTAYWKIKLLSQTLTKHIRVYFITLDEDGTLSFKYPVKKARAIIETELDCSYVLSEVDIEESTRVKGFDKFIEDLKSLLESKN